VFDYRLDDRGNEVRSTAEAKDFSTSLCVLTGSEAHLASNTMGTGGPFPGGKARQRRDADHSPNLVRCQKFVGAVFPLPLAGCMAVAGQLYFTF
jgi:hypothetical protein